ncbi:MAG: hypothetical protein Q8M69_19580, partial [Reyranella sp.]|nr:hypothetical protein [Reyranella sp.]
GAVSMTTFVNGKLASRADLPVGTSVGTFTVASAKDTITLKFEIVLADAIKDMSTHGVKVAPSTDDPAKPGSPVKAAPAPAKPATK